MRNGKCRHNDAILVDEHQHVKVSLLRKAYSGIKNNGAVLSTTVPELLSNYSNTNR
jgi:hypothetical protein